MVHDPGWLMMDIGKRIERGWALAALLRARLPASAVVVATAEGRVVRADARLFHVDVEGRTLPASPHGGNP